MKKKDLLMLDYLLTRLLLDEGQIEISKYGFSILAKAQKVVSSYIINNKYGAI
nr:hypothetical protein [uncultured Prevotella sp.]